MIQKLMDKKNKKGFTLIELIVVIAIIAILAAILIPRFGGFTDKAKSTQAMVNAKSIATAADGLTAEGTALTASNVATLAGDDIDSTKFTAGPAVDATTGRATFTYTDDSGFTAKRTADGKITVVKTTS